MGWTSQLCLLLFSKTPPPFLLPGRLSNAGWMVTDGLASIYCEQGSPNKNKGNIPKATGLRDVASGTPVRGPFSGTIHVHIPGQTLEYGASKSREPVELPWGLPGKEQYNCPDS